MLRRRQRRDSPNGYQRVARALAATRKPAQPPPPLQDAPSGASDDEE